MRRRRGFTVIELLAVIALVAIVAAILIPAAARARENARKATCISNIKSVGIFCNKQNSKIGTVTFFAPCSAQRGS